MLAPPRVMKRHQVTQMESGWRRLKAPEFWRWLFEHDCTFDEETSFELTLPFAEEQGLRVHVKEAADVTLCDLKTGLTLGWLDDGHPHPHCLRVTETLRLASAQHGVSDEALLLLCPFTVATTEEEIAQLEQAVLGAWRRLGLEGEGPEVGRCWFGDEGVRWQRDGQDRWSLRPSEQNSFEHALTTLRVDENLEFPAWLSHVT